MTGVLFSVTPLHKHETTQVDPCLCVTSKCRRGESVRTTSCSCMFAIVVQAVDFPHLAPAMRFLIAHSLPTDIHTQRERMILIGVVHFLAPFLRFGFWLRFSLSVFVVVLGHTNTQRFPCPPPPSFSPPSAFLKVILVRALAISQTPASSLCTRSFFKWFVTVRQALRSGL